MKYACYAAYRVVTYRRTSDSAWFSLLELNYSRTIFSLSYDLVDRLYPVFSNLSTNRHLRSSNAGRLIRFRSNIYVNNVKSRMMRVWFTSMQGRSGRYVTNRIRIGGRREKDQVSAGNVAAMPRLGNNTGTRPLKDQTVARKQTNYIRLFHRDCRFEKFLAF